MKKSLILGLLLLPLLFLSFVYPENKSGINNQPGITDTSYNLLVAYGKYIYQREKCNRCHTDTPGLDSTKISLENIAGKYPDSWHYTHLNDPRMVSPGSRMPRYYKLMKASLSYKVILELLREEYTTITEADSLEIQGSLENEAFPYLQMLKRDQIIPDKPTYNEAIALIAWLQYKPYSEERHIKDSIQQEEARKYEEKAIAKLVIELSDPESDLMKLATSKNKTAIERGKKYFSISCAVCHKEDAGGMIGPNLTDEFWLHGGKVNEIFISIYNGVPDHGMPAWKISFGFDQIAEIIAYIQSIQGSKPENAKAPQGKKMAD